MKRTNYSGNSKIVKNCSSELNLTNLLREKEWRCKAEDVPKFEPYRSPLTIYSGIKYCNVLKCHGEMWI